MRYAARRDLNEDDLVEAAERLGATIVYAGPLDFWVFHAKTGWVPTEAKNPNGRNRLTESQKKFMAKCLADNAPFFTWRTEQDVLKSLGASG